MNKREEAGRDIKAGLDTLSSGIAKLEEAAYQSGWDECATAMTDAILDVGGSSDAVVKYDVNGVGVVDTPSPKKRNRAIGSFTTKLLDYLESLGRVGATRSQIISKLGPTNRTTRTDNVIDNTLQRLRKSGCVKRVNDYWLFVKTPKTTGRRKGSGELRTNLMSVLRVKGQTRQEVLRKMGRDINPTSFDRVMRELESAGLAKRVQGIWSKVSSSGSSKSPVSGKLTPMQAEILDFMKSRITGPTTYAEMKELLPNVPKGTISSILSRLSKAGFLTQTGSGRGNGHTSYTVN